MCLQGEKQWQGWCRHSRCWRTISFCLNQRLLWRPHFLQSFSWEKQFAKGTPSAQDEKSFYTFTKTCRRGLFSFECGVGFAATHSCPILLLNLALECLYMMPIPSSPIRPLITENFNAIKCICTY